MLEQHARQLAALHKAFPAHVSRVGRPAPLSILGNLEACPLRLRRNMSTESLHAVQHVMRCTLCLCWYGSASAIHLHAAGRCRSRSAGFRRAHAVCNVLTFSLFLYFFLAFRSLVGHNSSGKNFCGAAQPLNKGLQAGGRALSSTPTWRGTRLMCPGACGTTATAAALLHACK
jgi:hypothetical protein